MDKIIIRTPDDLAPALPHILPYKVAEGSIVILDFKAEPVANLTPEILAQFDHHSEEDDTELAKSLAVFKGRNVILIRAGFHAPLAFVSRVMKIVGVGTAFAHSIPQWEIDAHNTHLPSRDEWAAKNQGQLDIARALADIIAEERAQ